LAWEASSQGNLEKLDELVKQCLEIYGDKAKSLQDKLTDFPEVNKVKEHQALNDVATLFFIKGEALMNYGKRDAAIEVFQHAIDTYPHAQAWDPRGWFWSVAEKSQASINVMLGIFDEREPEEVKPGLSTLPKLFMPGKEKVIDYTKYGTFFDVGKQTYRYVIDDPKGLSDAVGEGIYPNTNGVLKDPNYKKVKAEGRLDGDHWDFVRSDDLEAAFYKWATAKEPRGVRLFYLGILLEKAKMYYEAIKAYHAIIIHFPQTVGWTYWQTPWYPAQAAIAKIKHIIRTHPELKLKTKWMKIEITNGFDNDVSNDVTITYPGIVARKTWWDIIREKLYIEKPYVELGKVKETVGRGEVKLLQYENGHWQMTVKDEPYFIKGITYSPTKIGQSPDKGTLVSWMYEDTNGNSLADGPYDSWVDANRNNKQDPNEPVVGDFYLMKELGVNTIREYHQPFKPNKELLRKMFSEYGIRVIMGDFLGKYTLGSGATWFEGTDYENPEHQKNMMESVRRMVREFKD
jgi:beta-glucuronidase